MSVLMLVLNHLIPFVIEGWVPSLKLPPVRNNIFAALLQGVWIIGILEDTKQDSAKRRRYLRNYVLYQLALVPVMVLTEMMFHRFDAEEIIGTLGCSVFTAEGTVVLTAQILLFYFCRNNKKKLALWYTVYWAAYTLITVPQIPARVFARVAGTPLRVPVQTFFDLLGFETMQRHSFADSLLRINFQCFMIFALPLLLCYNGKRGKNIKRFFYVYYPAHIYILWLCSALIN